MPANHHDALFKAAFTDLDSARGELRAVLPPAVTALVDWGSLRIEPGSFVDAALRSRLTDLLFSVQLAGRDARIYVLFEHQSTHDPLLAFRVLAYEVRIWEKWRRQHPRANRLPPIVPVVLAQVLGGWRASPELIDVFDFANPAEREALSAHVPQLSLLIDDLAALDEGRLDQRDMPETAKLALDALRLARARSTLDELFGRLARRIELLPDTPIGREMLLAVLHYVASTRGIKELRTVQTAVARSAPQVRIRSCR